MRSVFKCSHQTSMRHYTKEGKSTGKRLLSQNCLYYQFDSTFFVYIIINIFTFNFLKATQSADNPFGQKEKGTRSIVQTNP